MVQAGSETLAEQFDERDFMFIFQFVMIIFIAMARTANGTCLVNWKHIYRSNLVFTFGLLSFLLIAFACYKSDNKSYFFVAILASTFTGIAQGLGEAAFLCFLKGFPAHLVGYVSTGTGFAGISGNLFLLGLKAAQLSNTQIYLTAIPTVFIYQISYFWLNKQKEKYPFVQGSSQESSDQENLLHQNNMNAETSVGNSKNAAAAESDFQFD